MVDHHFTAIAQKVSDPTRKSWGTRWYSDTHHEKIEITASDLHTAANLTHNIITEKYPDESWRIVSVEENRNAPLPSTDLVDKALIDAFADELADPDFANKTIYDENDYENFINYINTIASALCGDDIAPGLSVTLVHDLTYGGVDAILVEVYQGFHNRYLSKFLEIKNCTNDQKATGFNGLQAIAQALLEVYNELS